MTGDSRELILGRIRAANEAVARARGTATEWARDAGRAPDTEWAQDAGRAPGAEWARAAGPGAEPGRAEERGRSVDAEYAVLPRTYLGAHHDPASHDIVALFAERVADYRAVVERVPPAALPEVVARAVSARTSMIAKDHAHEQNRGRGDGPAPRFVVPAGLPGHWVSRCAEDCPGAELISDDPPLSAAGLDSMAGVITGCAVAIAETGTIVLDHGLAQGRRALTLVPDFHLVVVEAARIAADLPGAFVRLDPSRPHTLISGPSATSDIELVRVEGVHGPRNLHVLITAPG